MEICNKPLDKWIGIFNRVCGEVYLGSNNSSVVTEEICMWISVQDIQ